MNDPRTPTAQLLLRMRAVLDEIYARAPMDEEFDVQATLRDMLKEGSVSEAVLDGLSEIFNNMRGQLNRINMNPHVSPTDPEAYTPPADGAPESWIFDATKRIDLRGQTAFGPATLTIVGK